MLSVADGSILCRGENLAQCELRDVIYTFAVIGVGLYFSSIYEPHHPPRPLEKPLDKLQALWIRKR